MQKLSHPPGFSQTSVKLSQLKGLWRAEAVGHPEIPAVEHQSRQVAVSQLTANITKAEADSTYSEPTGW